MGVFKKQGMYWMDHYVSAPPRLERIGAMESWLKPD
jgi:hypothetical protein